jgi:hypothetical protein
VNRDELYLRHILDAIAVIDVYAEAGEEAFRSEVSGRTPCCGGWR